MAFRGEIEISKPTAALIGEQQEGKVGLKRYARRLSPSVLIPEPGTYTVAAVVVDENAEDPEQAMKIASGIVKLNESQYEQFLRMSY